VRAFGEALTVQHCRVDDIREGAHVRVDGRSARRTAVAIGNYAREVRVALRAVAGHRASAVSQTRVGASRCAGAQLRWRDADRLAARRVVDNSHRREQQSGRDRAVCEMIGYSELHNTHTFITIHMFLLQNNSSNSLKINFCVI
jgi:hypothetical protein